MSEPVRIAVCVERPDRKAGGAESMTFALIDYLRSRGHEVSVLFREGQASGSVDGGLPVSGRSWEKGRRVVDYARRCRRLLASLAPDVSVATGKELGTDIVWPHGGVHRASLLASLRGRSWWARLKRFSPKQRRFCALEREIYEQIRLSCVIAVSQRVRADLLRFQLVKEPLIQVIENGVDLARFRPDPEARARAREALDLKGIWALHVAHQKGLKGLDLALEALMGVSPMNLLVVGRGSARPFRSSLRKLGKRARWLGERSDLPDLYRACDLLLHPTRYDPCPLVTREAAASGLPIVSSREDGTADSLGAAGSVLESPSPRELAAILRGYLSSEARRLAGRAARDLAERRFCSQRSLRALEEVLLRVARERARSRAR